jgi:hypothetical protein
MRGLQPPWGRCPKGGEEGVKGIRGRAEAKAWVEKKEQIDLKVSTNSRSIGLQMAEKNTFKAI